MCFKLTIAVVFGDMRFKQTAERLWSELPVALCEQNRETAFENTLENCF